MKTGIAGVLLGAVLAVGMASPSWAQGSEEHSDNGGGHPGQSYYGSGYHRSSHAHVRKHARISVPRKKDREPPTTGQGAPAQAD
jgi:hypothetical protein